MAEEWFYAKGNQAHGPIGAAELKRLASTGALSPGDLVRKGGMTQWVRASSVKQLFTAKPQPIAVAGSSANAQATPESQNTRSTKESHAGLRPVDVFMNTCHEWLQDWTARGGTWGPFFKRLGYIVEWMQMFAGTRLPDGSKRSPTKAFYTVCVLICLSGTIVLAELAIKGVAFDTKQEYSVGYEFSRDGNRINLNQVEEKVRLHEWKAERPMHPLEKGACYLGSCVFGVAALWYAWKRIAFRSPKGV